MATVACPECAATVSVPDGTRRGVEVTCPGCMAPFLTPELPGTKPEATTVVGGRSDYLDADQFTPVRKPAKPKRPPVAIDGWVTVCFVVGSVLVAAGAGGSFVYTALKVQGRVAEGNAKGGTPLGREVIIARPPLGGDPTPIPVPGPPPAADPAPGEVNPATEPAPAPAAAGFPQPGTAGEAWTMLVGTWKLVEKPAVDPLDEPSLFKLTFAPDKSAVLTDNLFEHSKGQTQNFDDPNTVTRVAVGADRVTLHLQQHLGGDTHTLALTFEATDRVTVHYQPRRGGPEYKFRFARADAPATPGPSSRGAGGTPGARPGGPARPGR